MSAAAAVAGYTSTRIVSLRAVRDRTVRYPVAETGHSGAAAALARKLIGDAAHENVLAILLDPHQKVVGVQYAAIGGLSGVSLAIRDVFRAAVACNAAAVILSHNHPSGDPSPSDEDIAFTRRAIEAGQLLGTPVLDHVIVSYDRHVSMRVENARLWGST